MAFTKGTRNRNRQRKRGKLSMGQRDRRRKEKEQSERRSDKLPSKNAKVCSCHFKDKLKANTPTIFESKAQTFEIPEKKKKKSCPLIGCSAIGCPEQFKIGSNVGFYKFPSTGLRRDLWIRAVKRMNWSPSSTSVLCGKHFRSGRPVGDPTHRDYVPSKFGVLSSLQNSSYTAQIEESQNVIQGRVEDTVIVPDSSFSTADINAGRPSKDPFHPDNTNLLASTISEEKHTGQSSTVIREESRCIIYDKIEIEDMPIDEELSSTCVLSEAPTAGMKNNVLGIGTEVEQQNTEVVTIKKEIDELIIPDAAQIERSTLADGIKNKVSGVGTNLEQLTAEAVVIKKEIEEPLIPNTAQTVFERSITEKEEEISKLKRELRQAHAEIRALRSEKEALQNCIINGTTDRILNDARKLHFFTGLNSIKEFYFLTKMLHGADTTAVSLPASTQLLIVLMRLQLNLKFLDLADRFQTSVDIVCRICGTMIPHLESKLKLLLEGLSPISVGMQTSVSRCYTNSVFVKLHETIQRYIKP